MDAFFHWLGAMSDSTPSEDAPVNNARQTITDLKAGRIPQTVVRDLGDAVSEATRNHDTGRAIGRTFTGGLGR